MQIDRWGVADGYWDTNGQWHETSPAVRDALHEALGARQHGDGPPPLSRPLRVLDAGTTVEVAGGGVVVLEDGTEVAVHDTLPPDLPLGYHVLHTDAGEERLIVAPRQVPDPPARAWGWAAQLYAVRSRRSWGIGDLDDLDALTRWAARLGASIVLLNPLHAAVPVAGQQDSPYYPASRLFRNVLYLGMGGAPPPEGEWTARRIDRDAVLQAKLPALEQRWRDWEAAASPGERDAFAAYRREQAEALEAFSTFCVAAEQHGQGWASWPVELRDPTSPAVGRLAAATKERRRFHQWCQWQLDRQLARAAGNGVGLVTDLAVGVDPGGFDTWYWQDVFALGARVGAPPDTFEPDGQDWGLPPFVPWKLREAHYEPFVRVVRAALGHSRGVRIDHVMGLFRLWWVAPGERPTEGAYVYYPWEEMLRIVALEAHRADAFVVGEDLGTVEDEVRTELGRLGVLSTRLVWFEEQGPASFPPRSFGAITTHDLPTVAGVWTGADVEAQRSTGRTVPDDANDWFRSRLELATGLPDDAPLEDVLVTAHRALAAAPSAVVVATLDDAVGVPERPNHPGTTDEWPNWKLALPVTLEELETHPLANAIAQAMAAERPRSAPDRGR